MSLMYVSENNGPGTLIFTPHRAYFNSLILFRSA